MSIAILFFAQLREQLACEKMNVDIPHPFTVSELRSQLIEQNPTWAMYLNHQSILFSVNQSLVKSSHLIHEGDEVAFFPPVTGG